MSGRCSIGTQRLLITRRTLGYLSSATEFRNQVVQIHRYESPSLLGRQVTPLGRSVFTRPGDDRGLVSETMTDDCDRNHF
jgi:hypothetical protein